MLKKTALFLLLIISAKVYAQDTLPVYTWKVTGKKIADKQYELNFTASGKAENKLYAPSQDLEGVMSAELSFADSSVSIESFVSEKTTQSFTSSTFNNKVIKYTSGDAQWKALIKFTNKVPAELLGSITVFFEDAEGFKPDLPFSFSTALEGGVSNTSEIKIASIDISKPAAPCGDDFGDKKSFLEIFLLGLLGGFIALLTPCLFPLIPVTVTFFTKKSTDRGGSIRNASLYGFFIFLIYVLITVPFHFFSNINDDIFNNLSTNVPLNLAFFAVFILFALSFFGLFEITLPAYFANKADSKAGLGNIGGIFFMAATLTIVSFSCTGPLFGTLLTGVLKDGAWPLTVGAAGFGLALGLPFALFALFPNWLKSLPKSGGWMTDVKVVLGFIEVALAVKFLANADNVQQWGFLKREVFFALWILCGLGIVLYLLGWIRLGHSSPVTKFSKTRIAFIIFFAALTLYLVPGVTNTQWANLKLLSGFPPPISYTIYKDHVLLSQKFKPIHNDYKKALQLAKEQNKPILIDFTGWACANCRRMEENVWINKEVYNTMANDFIVLSLYVDERIKLPASEQMVFTDSSGKKKQIITVGDKWSTFQSVNFKAVAQPQYAIISADERALTKTKFYTPDAGEFLVWLKCGVEANKKKR